MLPRIKIEYLNGQLGTVGESPDGLFALACGASAVAGKFELEKAYSVRSMDDVQELGIEAGGNGRLYKHLKEFYDEAEAGTEVVVWGVEKTATMSEACDKTTGSLRKLVESQNGRLRGIFLAGDGLSTAAAREGLDPDVFAALPVAQQLAEWSTEELYAPIFVVLEGRGYTGEDLKDLSELSYNRVCVLVGDTESGSEGACVGLMAGRLSGLPVHRNLGRVKNGALHPVEMWLGTKKVEESGSAIAGVYDKGYICPRKYVGRSGYFFTDDRLACEVTDDYAHLTGRRVVDKAYRIVYDTLLDMLLDELEVNEDGTLQTGVVKSWQQTVENVLNREMTASGELSASDGEGCSCYIDPSQNVLATSKVAVTVKVRPFGYAREVDVKLGFLVTQTA